MELISTNRLLDSQKRRHIEDLRTPSMIVSTLIGERKCLLLVGTNQNSLTHVNNLKFPACV